MYRAGHSRLKKIFNYQRPPIPREDLESFRRPACFGLAVHEGHFSFHLATPECRKNLYGVLNRTGNPYPRSRSLRRPNSATKIRGGADRDRTDDLRLAMPALSQLSYSPKMEMVGLGGFEPPTSRLSGGRSNQLSYRPAPKRPYLCVGCLSSATNSPTGGCPKNGQRESGGFDHSLRSPKTEWRVATEGESIETLPD